MRPIALFIVLACCASSCDRARSTSGGNSSAAAPSSAASASGDAEHYIAKDLKLYALAARYEESELDGRVPAITFKIRNDGDRTLDTVKVRVIFKDAAGRAIDEEEYSPVLYIRDNSGAIATGDNKPLRPGYIWQMERGKFFNAKSVPSEWKEGSAEARIISVVFAPDEVNAAARRPT